MERNQLSIVTKQKKQKRRRVILPVLLYAILYAVCVVAVMTNPSPEQHNFSVGAISEQTVTAPRDIIDEYSTELLRQEAMTKVSPEYHKDETVEADTIEKVRADFVLFEQIRVAAKQMIVSQSTSAQTGEFDPSEIDWEAELQKSEKNELRQMSPEYLEEQNILTIAKMEQDKLISLRDTLMERIQASYETGVLVDGVDSALEYIHSSLTYNGAFTNAQVDLADLVARQYMAPNMIFDAEATEAAKEAAAAAVQPVEYKKGQNIVQKGEEITQAQYEMIREIGLLRDDDSLLLRWIVVLLLVGLLFLVGYLYMRSIDTMLLESKKNIYQPVFTYGFLHGIGAFV